MPLSLWPTAEREAWETALAPRSSLFGRAGRAVELRPATVASYQHVVGQWLAHLQRHGWLLERETPAQRFQIERLNALMVELDGRGLKPSSICQMLAGLMAAMKYIAPAADLSWLTRPGGQPLSKALPSKRQEIFAPDLSLALPFVRRMHAKALLLNEGPERRRLLRDAALIGLFVTLGPRRASVVRMRFDRLRRRDDGTWLVMLRSEDTKNHRRLELPLTAEMTTLLDDYLRLGRPGFTRADATDHVWLGMKGPLTPEGMSRAYRMFSQACFGEVQGTHSARRMLRAAAARISPDLAWDAALTLGHSQEMSVKHYTESCNLYVGLRHGDRVQRLRAGDVRSEPALTTPRPLLGDQMPGAGRRRRGGRRHGGR